MQVAFYNKSITPAVLPFVKELIAYLAAQQAQVMLPAPLRSALEQHGTVLPPVQAPPQDYTHTDLVISLGGDGTLLEAVNHIGPQETPILAINTGRMGFLATVSPQEAKDALHHFLQGTYSLDQRSLVQVQAQGLAPQLALNEIAVLKQDSAAMITIHVTIDDAPATTYWADGLIIATPTGSTGYSLSCGGPIVLPSAHNLVITPVSPHNLSVRPLVIPDHATVVLRVESRNEKFLTTLDGRSESTPTTTQLAISKAPFQANLVKTDHHNVFDTLRQKLHWGLDIRN